MRFAFGAGFAARRLTRALAKSLARNPAAVAASSVATARSVESQAIPEKTALDS